MPPDYCTCLLTSPYGNDQKQGLWDLEYAGNHSGLAQNVATFFTT